MEEIGECVPELHTGHYLLRGIKENDANSLYEILSNKTTMKYITPHPVESVEDMEEKIKGYLQKFQDEKEIPWVIVDQESYEVIGLFRLHKLHMWHKKAELGAIIHPDFQKSGVMTEVLECILYYAFYELKLNRIVGDIFSGNEASRRLLHKFGFTREGILRQTDFDGTHYHDTEVFSLLISEYEMGVANSGEA